MWVINTFMVSLIKSIIHCFLKHKTSKYDGIGAYILTVPIHVLTPN